MEASFDPSEHIPSGVPSEHIPSEVPSTWKPEDLRHCFTPYLDATIDGASRRLAVCDFIKSLEKAGKSSVIDSFARKGLSVGAHRACDPLHDPLFGVFLSVRELGVRETVNKWFPHMASDVLTARSLPLPGTFLLGTDSWIVRMYARGLLNLRSAIIAPALGVVITEVMVRGQVVERLTKRARTRDKTDLLGRLEREHFEAALVAGGVAVAIYFVPSVAVAATFAFGASAVWSLGAGGFYYVRRHRSEISRAIQRVASQQRVFWQAHWEAAVARRLIEREKRRPRSTATEQEPPIINVADAPERPSRPLAGLAVALAGALAHTSPSAWKRGVLVA